MLQQQCSNEVQRDEGKTITTIVILSIVSSRSDTCSTKIDTNKTIKCKMFEECSIGCNMSYFKTQEIITTKIIKNHIIKSRRNTLYYYEQVMGIKVLHSLKNNKK